jgi:hypothetical protein
MSPQLSTGCSLSLTNEERVELLLLLEDSLGELHSEIRRTEAPEYHDKLRAKETLIRQLTDRVRKLHP